MSKRRNLSVVWLWKIPIGLGLLIWIFYAIFRTEAMTVVGEAGARWEQLSGWERLRLAWHYGPAGLGETIMQVGWPAFLISWLCVGGALLGGVVRWRLLLGLQGVFLGFGRVVEISMVAQFFNSFLLGSTGGDVMKGYYVARETAARKTEAVATVVIDRLVGLFSMLLFSAIGVAINLELWGGSGRLMTLATAVFLMLAVCSVAILLAFWGGGKGEGKWMQWIGRLPGGEIWLRAMASGRRLGASRAVWLAAVGISTGVAVFCTMQVAFLAWGMGISISVWPLAFVVPAIICISALPITPNGLGVRENLYVWTLTVPYLGVAPAEALTISLLAFAGSLLWSLLGGLVYLTLRKRHHLDTLETEGAGADPSEPAAAGSEAEGPTFSHEP